MADELPLLTTSRMKSYRACPRQHYYRYVQGYVPVLEPEARHFGTCMHNAWEAYWIARKLGATPIDRFLTAIRQLPAKMDPFARAKAEAMLVFYTWVWDHQDVVVLAIEKEFRHPLINPDTGAKSRTWQRAGKMDVVVALPDGRIAILEHKTTSEDTEPGSIYRQKLALDPQITEYFDGGDSVAREFGYERIDVAIYDVAVKPLIRPKKATPEADREYTKEKSRVCAMCKKKNAPPAPHHDEDAKVDCVDGRVVTDPGGRLHSNQRDRDEMPEEYFDRCVEAIQKEPGEYFQQLEIVRLETERQEYQWDIWQLGALMRESERLGRAPKNPSSCFLYNTPCDFWGPCTHQSSLDDPYKFKKLKQVSQELATEEPKTATTEGVTT